MDKDITNGHTETPADIRTCRVADIGYSSYAECLCSGPNLCRYALPFGYGYLCQHPQLDEIIEKTKQAASQSISK
jgi:hypothetical protein